jgi:sortase A
MVEMFSGYVVKFKRPEQILLAIGLTLLTIWGVSRFHGAAESRAAIARFQAENATTSLAPNPSVPPDPILSSKIDFRFWSIKRIEAYADSLTKKTDAPLAILRIPKINLEVPVFNDTDDLTLNRGVGRILGTAQIGRPGNLGIAGHRDGFFRGLKDIAPGDTIELLRRGGTDRYAVSQIQIVTPADTYVLDEMPKPTLTLVTCFPFYYVGNAPKRYIVTAGIENSSQGNQLASRVSITTGNTTNNKEKKK